MFRLGLVVNPVAGIGGACALKGSDGLDLQTVTQRYGAELKAQHRARQFIEALEHHDLSISLITGKGAMGSDVLVSNSSFDVQVIGSHSVIGASTAVDTQKLAKQILEKGVDLLVFVGGDGTARDICQVVSTEDLVLGVPAGVKMHSGVFSVTPESAAEIIARIINHHLTDIKLCEVRDIDENALRQGQVKSRYYGELLTPQCDVNLQRVKCSGPDIDELILDDMADFIQEQEWMTGIVIMGAGSTTFHIKQRLTTNPTLLGVDVFEAGVLVAADVTEVQLHELVRDGETAIIVSLTGGQGALIGRGNQQLSARILNRVGRKNLHVVASRAKLQSLEGRSMLIDSGDMQTNKNLSGFYPVITGYDQKVLYPAGNE